MADYNPKSIGILGGTFDPIHFGHCRAALEIQQKLHLSEVRLIPCNHPPHRPPPDAEAHHRLKMVSLAISSQSSEQPTTSHINETSRLLSKNERLITDDRELKRDGPSYTIDTLMSLRKEFPHTSLLLLVGIDAFLSLPSWYQWEKIIQLANIVVMYRSGWNLPEEGIMNDLLKQHSLKANTSIDHYTHGKITRFPITLLDIQASQIRAMIKEGVSPRFLLSEKVIEYIQIHELYGYNRNNVSKHTKGVTQA